MTDETAPHPTLAQAASGYRATLLSQAVRVACKFAGVVVLARLVSPAEHGLFAMAASLTFLLTLFRDFGTSAAAIQAPALTDGQMTALYRLQLVLGVALAGLTVLVAPAVAIFYGDPRVTPLLFAMSASFILNGANNWPRTLLNRELRFREFNRIETLGAVVGTIAMMAGGALGAGAFAFVIYLLVSEAVMLVEARRLCRWRPRAPADWSDLRALSRTGLQLTGYNLLLYGLQQADTLLMGRWFGAGALGLYNRASQLLMQPATHLAAPMSQVLLATLSRLGPGSADFARHFRETTNTIAHLTLPIAVACVVVPDEVVRLVLGSAWPEAAPLLRWLAISAFATYLTSTVYALCVAPGHPARLIQLTAIALPLTLLGLWLGRDLGPIGLAIGLASTNVVLLVPRLWWAARQTPVRLQDYFEAFAGPIAVSAALAAGLSVGRVIAGDQAIAVRLPVVALTGAAAFGLCGFSWPRVRQEWERLWQHRPFGHPAP